MVGVFLKVFCACPAIARLHWWLCVSVPVVVSVVLRLLSLCVSWLSPNPFKWLCMHMEDLSNKKNYFIPPCSFRVL